MSSSTSSPAVPAPAAPASPFWTLAPFIFVGLWSTGFTIGKLALHHIEPITLLGLRYVAVVAILLPIALVIRPAWPRRVMDWVHVAVVGFLIQVVYFILSYLSLAHGLSASANGLIASLQPILVTILAPWLVGERVEARRWVGLALGLAGGTVVMVARSAVEVTSMLGLVYGILSLFGMTAATLYEKRFGRAQNHPVATNIVQYTVGALFALPIAWATETMRVDWNFEMTWVFAYLVLGNSLTSITLLLAMVRRGEASKVSALFFLIPPLSAAVSWAWIGEAMPPLAWVGMAIAAAGVAVALRPTRPRTVVA